jgi:DNA-binding transcriptional LysR family regulator
VIGARSWRLADLGAKHALLLAGIGWGNMPEPILRDDLAASRLKRLDLPDSTGGFYALEAMYRTDRPPGPAAAWMIERFSEQVKNKNASTVGGKSNGLQRRSAG